MTFVATTSVSSLIDIAEIIKKKKYLLCEMYFNHFVVHASCLTIKAKDLRLLGTDACSFLCNLAFLSVYCGLVNYVFLSRLKES